MKITKKMTALLLILTMVFALTAATDSKIHAADNTTFANALAIKENIPVSVTIGTEGLIRYYSFIPIVSGTYIFESSNCSGAGTLPYATLYDANQTLLANFDFNNGGFRIVHTLTAGEKYVIAAQMFFNTASYTLTIKGPAVPGSTIPTGWNCIYEENSGNYCPGEKARYVSSMMGLEPGDRYNSLYCDFESDFDFQVGDVIMLDLDVRFGGDSNRFIDASSRCSIELYSERGILVARYYIDIWGNVKHVYNSQATHTITSQTAGKLTCKVYMEEPGATGVYPEWVRLSLKIDTVGYLFDGEV